MLSTVVHVLLRSIPYPQAPKLRVAAEAARVGEARLPVAGGHIAPRFSRRDARPERQASVARGASPLGHRRNGDGQRSWRGAYRARPQRGGNGASRSGWRLPARSCQVPQFSLARALPLKLQSLASDSLGKKDVHPSNHHVCRCRVNPQLRRTVPLPFQPHYFVAARVGLHRALAEMYRSLWKRKTL